MLAKIVQPYHLKVFFSNKFVHASILDTLQNVCVTSVSTNNKLFDSLIGTYKPKNDVRACLAVAKLLAEKAQQLQVCNAEMTLTNKYLASPMWRCCKVQVHWWGACSFC